MATSLPTDLPIALFADADEWEAWLVGQDDSKGVWLKIAKKGAGVGSITYADALDVALCHGWIDGQKRRCDERYYLQRFTPRRPRSVWSKINIGHVERLTAAGRMRALGLREVDAAKADGRWDRAYGGGRDMPVPEELANALASNAKARRFFEQLDRTNRYAFCWRVQTAKKAETRRLRAVRFVEMLEKGEKLHA